MLRLQKILSQYFYVLLGNDTDENLQAVMRRFNMFFSNRRRMVPDRLTASADLVNFLTLWQAHSNHRLMALEGNSPSV
jgi:hypothetical protein